jgi:hypothetical protein
MQSNFDWPSYLEGLASGPSDAPDGPPPAVLLPHGADATLWRAALAASPLVTPQGPAVLAALAAADELLAAGHHAPLRPADDFAALEVWTECELSALHALWRLHRLAPTRLRHDRLQALVAWHLEHTQPDNATNRPWAAHVFVRQGSPEALLYASTLAHNVQASDARGEPLTAWILHDSARELRLAMA